MNKTYSKEGLTELQVTYCEFFEQSWLLGLDLGWKSETFRRYIEKNQIKGDKEKAPQFLKAWEYWDWMPKPGVRNSVVEAVKISDVLEHGHAGLYDRRQGLFTRIEGSYNLKPEIAALFTLLSSDYFFEILEGNRLFLKQNQLLSNRFIAYIKD